MLMPVPAFSVSGYPVFSMLLADARYLEPEGIVEIKRKSQIVAHRIPYLQIISSERQAPILDGTSRLSIR